MIIILSTVFFVTHVQQYHDLIVLLGDPLVTSLITIIMLFWTLSCNLICDEIITQLQKSEFWDSQQLQMERFGPSLSLPPYGVSQCRSINANTLNLT